MDYITEVESELANFTKALFQGLNEIQQKPEISDPNARVKLVNSLSSDLMSSHANVMDAINRIPDDIFIKSREAQENEIKSLELKYEQSVSRLSTLKTHAQIVFESLESNLDKIK